MDPRVLICKKTWKIGDRERPGQWVPWSGYEEDILGGRAIPRCRAAAPNNV